MHPDRKTSERDRSNFFMIQNFETARGSFLLEFSIMLAAKLFSWGRLASVLRLCFLRPYSNILSATKKGAACAGITWAGGIFHGEPGALPFSLHF
jgi:hypothetical protein